jgi:hypothetical protein
VADALEDAGFVIKERVSASDVIRYVGYLPERSPARISIPAPRAVDLYLSLLHITRDRWVVIDVLHSLVSMWIWCALVRRDLLCSPSSVFGFITVNEGKVVTLLRLPRSEVVAMARALPLAFADLGAPLCDVVMGTDAMGASALDHGGFAVVARKYPLDTVKTWFQFGSSPAYTVARLGGDMSGLRDPAREARATKPFSLIPADAIGSADQWLSLTRGRWSVPDHITLGESRAVVCMLDIFTCSGPRHRCRVLSLQDNQPTAGAMAKGRSPADALNSILRRKAARCLASQTILLLPWVESAKQPADLDSRLI